MTAKYFSALQNTQQTKRPRNKKKIHEMSTTKWAIN